MVAATAQSMWITCFSEVNLALCRTCVLFWRHCFLGMLAGYQIFAHSEQHKLLLLLLMVCFVSLIAAAALSGSLTLAQSADALMVCRLSLISFDFGSGHAPLCTRHGVYR